MPELKKEQLDALMHGEGNILVSASAGSGKTFVMIERLIRLITEGKADVNEILAVTFTEAAAADMKEKLKKALIEKINDTGDMRLTKQLSEVSSSDISTLHSFCGRLIRTYFFVAAVSPDFKIIDESDALILKNEAIEKTFKEFYDSKESWFLSLADRHAQSRSDKKLKELVLSAFAFANAEADPDKLMGVYSDVYSDDGFDCTLEQYKRMLDSDLDLLKEEVVAAFGFFNEQQLVKSAEFCRSLIGDIDFVLKEKNIYAVKKLEDYSRALSFDRKLSDDALDFKFRAVAVRDKLKKLFKRFGKHLTTEQSDRVACKSILEHTERFVRVVKRFEQIYSELKREENALDFGDLEHFALKVLKDEQITAAVREKYKYVFVDEYQDINGVQEEIILKVSHENAFMVGDVKQSIYGFRGCRPEIFSEKLQRMNENGEKTVLLNYNFRSADAILNTVNRIFAYSMTEKFFGTSYLKTSMLKSGGIYDEQAKGRTELHLLVKENARDTEVENPRVYDILEEIKREEIEENYTEAALITKIINDELTKTFYDPKEKKFKQITNGDIAILTRNKNNKYVSDIVKGLNRHGVSVSSEVKENVCDFPEVQMMINALKLVDCFLQDVPLAVTLKSPIGGLSDEELYDIALFYRDVFGKDGKGFTAAYKYYVENANTPLKQKLKTFEEYFNKIRLVSDFVGAHGVIQKLVADKDVESYLLAQNQGEKKLGRIRQFIEMSLSGGKTLTIKEFLSKIENSPDAFGMADCAEEDTIKVMTIHASKGLEFPVVIVCGLDRKMNSEEDRMEVLFDRELAFAFKEYDDQKRVVRETPLRGLILEKLKADKVKEELRLFYVATTRATYSMHLTFVGKEDARKDCFTGADRFLDYIPLSLPITEHSEVDFEFEELKKGVRKVIIGKHDEKLSVDMKNNFSYVYPHEEDTKLPLKNSVTAAVKDVNNGDYATHVIFDEESPDPERGTIAHKILELFDFTLGKDVYEQTEHMIARGLLTREEVSKINLDRIDKALTSGAFSGFDKKTLFRERAFLVSIEANKIFDGKGDEGVLMQGVIDLLAVDDDTAEVIDYKYSSLSKGSLLNRYKKQLELYSYAVEKVLGKKVVKKELINLFSGERVEII